MKHHRVLQFGEDLPALVRARLESAHVAWVIDAERGCIVAANRAGAALFGLCEDEPTHPAPKSARPPSPSSSHLPGFVLDAAMPALGRLRLLAAEAGARTNVTAQAPEPLVFWTPRGALRLVCRIHFTGKDGATLAIVTAEAGAQASRSMAAIALPAAASAPIPTPVAVPQLFAGDDAAKLKEIARRIREGQTSARAERRRPGPPPHTPGAHATALSSTLRAGLAHELRTPVSAIAAAAEIMKDQRFGPLGAPRYLGYAADIRASAEHVLGVIDRMLAEAGDPASGGDPELLAGELDFAELDTAAVLEQAVSQIAPLAERAGIALALDLAARVPHLVADLTSLRQIVFNLLTNALKFTRPGGQVTVAARYSLDGPLAISVTDTGSGIAPQDIARLLGPDSAPTPAAELGEWAAGHGGLVGEDGLVAQGGLGIGLPLVRALAAANGAKLVIESVPGQGTTASVVFAKDRVIPV